MRELLIRYLLGELEPHEHDAVRWLGPDELDRVAWLAPDLPFLPELEKRLRGGAA